jgi:hypothetical protein
MSDYIIVSPFVQPGPVTATHTSPQCAVGLEVDAIDRAASTAGGGAYGRFVYARGSNMASGGQFVHLINGSAVLLASANSASAYAIGCAPAALTATNVYGWVQVVGRVDYARGTNTAPTSAVPYYFAATAGMVLTNAGAGSRIQGIFGVPGQTNTAVSSAGSYQYDLNRPFCAGLTAAL